jgi:hypothetical protein
VIGAVIACRSSNSEPRSELSTIQPSGPFEWALARLLMAAYRPSWRLRQPGRQRRC